MSFCETQLSDEAQLLHRFQGNQKCFKSSLLLSPQEMLKKQIPNRNCIILQHVVA